MNGRCDLCNQPLDEYALGLPSDYCSDCITPLGSLAEVLAYHKVTFADHDLFAGPSPASVFDTDGNEVLPDDDGRTRVPWPHPKDPSVWFEQACRLYPGWRRIVTSYLRLKGLRRFDLDALRSLVEFVRERGKEKTYEEVAVRKREAVLAMVEGALLNQSAAAHEPATLLLGDPLLVRDYQTARALEGR
jgi:hypothetical protein